MARARRWMRRHRALTASLAAAVVVTLGALVTGNIIQASLNERLERALAESRQKTYLSNVALADLYLVEGNGNRARQLLAESPEEYRRWEWRHLSRRVAPSMANVDLEDSPSAVAWRSGAEQFLSVRRGTVEVRHAADGKLVEKRELQLGSETETLSADGQRAAFLVRVLKPPAVTVYEISTGKQIASLEEERGLGMAAALSHDGKYVAYSLKSRFDAFLPRVNILDGKPFDKSPTVVIRNVATGEQVAGIVHEFASDRSDVPFIDGIFFNRDASRILVTGSVFGEDACIAVYEVKTGKRLLVLPAQQHSLMAWPCAAISRDGKLLAVGGVGSDAQAALIKLYDVDRGKEIATFKGHTARISSLAFDHAGKKLAFGSTDQSVIVWDLASRRQEKQLLGHDYLVKDLYFSEDDRGLMSVSAKNVRLWGTDDDGAREIVRPKAGAADCTVFLPGSGKFAATFFADGKLHIWDAATGREEETNFPRTFNRPASRPMRRSDTKARRRPIPKVSSTTPIPLSARKQSARSTGRSALHPAA